MSECIFCKIVNKEIPSDIVYEDENVLAFKDLNPVAPTHILFIPKKHIPTLLDLDSETQHLVGEIHRAVVYVAKELGLEKGFRLVGNCNEHGGQEVFHIHYHLLAGRELQWPPG
ncbi:MAG: histidine triad nucleotide-binding protein [Clostridiales bacterium]|nr:histidine triad nucleotide-binding protein [Clostridiales bacterium]MCF8021451.1 histidine triad nucleotide-binding protein [Clostridiales bacterium]